MMRYVNRVVTYISLISMVGVSLQWAFFFTIVQAVSPMAYAADNLINELHEKHDLTKPKPVESEHIHEKMMKISENLVQSGRDLEKEVLTRPPVSSGTIDFDKHKKIDFHQEYNKYLGGGIKVDSHVPTMTNDGNSVGMNYYEGGTIRLKRDENGKLISEAIPADQLGPKVTEMSNQEIFSNQQNRDDVEFNAPNHYGDGEGYNKEIKKQYQNSLTGTTMDAHAHKAILNAQEKNKPPQLSTEDYFFKPTEDALADVNKGEGMWDQNCKEETVTTDKEIHLPIWEDHLCTKNNPNNPSFCEVTRVLEELPPYDEEIHAKFGITWGENLTVEVDFKSGTSKPISSSPPMSYVEYADDITKLEYNLICNAGAKIEYIGVGPWWDMPIGGNTDDSIGFEVIQAPTCENRLIGKFKVWDHRGGWDSEWDLGAHFKFRLQATPVNETYIQNPEGCADKVGWRPGPYPCSGNNCYKPTVPNNKFCSFKQWEILEQGTNGYPQHLVKLVQKLFPSDPNPEKNYAESGKDPVHYITWKINAKDYRCDPFAGGKICTDVYDPATDSMVNKCFTYEEIKNQENSCQKYEKNPRCKVVKEECSEGWLDTVDNVCYNWTVDYKCDVSKPIITENTVTTNQCVGLIPCLGNDCNPSPEEENKDFNNAMIMGSIIQNVQGDSTCKDGNPNTCEIFPGEKEYCSWELSGMGNNCCEQPEGINPLELMLTGYKMMQTETFKSISSTIGQKLPTQVTGLYDDIGSMLVNGWNTGATAVVEWTSSILGDPEFMSGIADAITIGETALGEGVNAALAAAQQQMFQFINKLLPDAVSELIFSEVTTEAGTATGELALSNAAQTVMNIISFVGVVYMIYNIVKIAANLLTACDENEMDVGVKLAQRMCFQVGDKYCYKDMLGVCLIRRKNLCCYKSMLARIIGQQGSVQIGKDMNACNGFTIDEFSKLDFDKMDLSEWLSGMYETDILSKNGYDADRLTGKGRMFAGKDSSDIDRLNVHERTSEQFSTNNMSDTARQNYEKFNPYLVDCSVSPRPLICELK